MEKKKIYEVTFDDLENEDFGIHAISDVKSPAIDSLFVALSEDKETPLEVKLMDDDKHLLIGLALIPNKPIKRVIEEEEFYIIFSKDTIRQASQLYLKRNNQNNTTLEHEAPIDGVTTVESWIVEDTKMDKTALYGLSAPVGSWAVVKKVYNEEYWLNEVKTGNVKGFSIEGVFKPTLRTDLKEEAKIDNYDEKLKKVKELLNII